METLYNESGDDVSHELTSPPTTAVALDPECMAHDMGRHHPESPARLQALIQLLESEPVTSLNLQRLAVRLASEEELARIHGGDYFRALASSEGGSLVFDPDTTAGPRSFEAARRAAGAALSVTDAVCEGKARNAFALIRPPGHHAEPSRAMGFCFFNSVAVAAAHARIIHGHQRIAVVDFDVHHGNGTQSAFWNDPETLYISSHQYPFYPGSGTAVEVGGDKATGTTVNIPLPGGQGDAEYTAIYGALVPRILEQFRPDLILVSAGFDLMTHDPLGGMRVSADGVGAIARALTAAAERLCSGRIAFLLEGGYDLTSLRQGVEQTLRALQSPSVPDATLPGFDESALGPARRDLPVWRSHWHL